MWDRLRIEEGARKQMKSKQKELMELQQLRYILECGPQLIMDNKHKTSNNNNNNNNNKNKNKNKNKNNNNNNHNNTIAQ